MLTGKLARIKELIDQKEKIDAELEALLGNQAEAPKRGRPRKSAREGSQNNGSAEKDVDGQQTLQV